MQSLFFNIAAAVLQTMPAAPGPAPSPVDCVITDRREIPVGAERTELELRFACPGDTASVVTLSFDREGSPIVSGPGQDGKGASRPASPKSRR
jgi:hypothetical protein